MEAKIYKSVYAVLNESALKGDIDLDATISKKYPSSEELNKAMKKEGVRDYTAVYRYALCYKGRPLCVGLGLTISEAKKDLESDAIACYNTTLSEVRKNPQMY